MRFCMASVIVCLGGAARVPVESHPIEARTDNGSALAEISAERHAVSTMTNQSARAAMTEEEFSGSATTVTYAGRNFRLVQAERHGNQPAGWMLASHGTESADRRDRVSNYVFMHNTQHSSWAGEWTFEDGDRRGVYRIKLVTANEQQPAGWYLASHGTVGTDRRNDWSNYAFVTEHAWGASQWEIVCGARNDWFQLRVSDSLEEQPAGWYLASHNSASMDSRNSNSNYAFVHEGQDQGSQFMFESISGRNIMDSC